MTAFFALAGLAITHGTAPTDPGTPPAPGDPASRPSSAATAPIARSGAESASGDDPPFEHRTPDLPAEMSGRQLPGGRWTALVPVVRLPEGARRAHADRAQGHDQGARRAATLTDGALRGTPHAPGPPYKRAPATPHKPNPPHERPPRRETPAPPRRTPSPPWHGPRHDPPRGERDTTTRTPPGVQDRPPYPMGDPCARFTDFRRYYCDRLIGGHGS
ncbi:hypothetical protein [Sphaerisporangium album]|uniref:hypothetical protein n=1 Tax=Sphaerisporangium album TaxID=509200 RepID=UPI0011C0276D|nr:hypothetical protein [Sphaerisporangium album]